MCSIAENEDDIKPACPRAQGWPQKFRFIQHLLCSTLTLNLSLIQANENVHNLPGQGSLLNVPVDRLPLTRELQRTSRVKSEFLTNESGLFKRIHSRIHKSKTSSGKAGSCFYYHTKMNCDGSGSLLRPLPRLPTCVNTAVPPDGHGESLW